MTSWTVAAPARAERGPAAAVATALRRLYLPSFGIAAITVWVASVAVIHLRHDGRLGTVLSAGRAELIGPALVVLIVAAVACEQLWPAERHPALSRGRVHDACFLVLHVTTVVPLMTLLGVGFAALISEHAGWVEVSWTAGWPTWLVVGVTLVAMDGANWLAHYADHRFEPLWRLHAVHHTQEELSVLTSFRAHPFVHVTGFMLATVPVVVLMGDRAIAPILITAYVCLGTLTHTNVRWTFGPLGRVVVSPAYHRLHHWADGPAGTNLGIVLTVWDVLARRACFPTAGDPVCRTGLAGRPLAVEQADPRPAPLRRLASQLLEPFVAAR